MGHRLGEHQRNTVWGQRRTVHQIPLDKSLVLGSQRVHYVRLTKQTDDRDWQGIANGLQEQLERVERSHRETIEDATIQQAGLLASLRLVHDQQAAEQQRFDTESRRQEDIARAQATQIVHLEDEHHRLQAELAQQQVTLADTAEKDSAHLEELQHCREEVLRLQQERTELDSRLANREQELADRARELERLTAEVERQRNELQHLTEALVTERDVLKNLELHLKSDQTLQEPELLEEEHCVVSPDFHAMLDEALGALPRLDD